MFLAPFGAIVQSSQPRPKTHPTAFFPWSSKRPNHSHEALREAGVRRLPRDAREPLTLREKAA
jgi:hypothetical protein